MDAAVFHALNGLAGRSVAIDALIIFGATYAILLMALAVFAYGFAARKTPALEGRAEDVTHVALTVIIAFAAERLIGFLWFRPRPFVTLEGVVKLADRLPHEKSFPSSHATLAFAMAFGLLLHNRKWGETLLAVAVLVALSRVAAGVHYPSDVLGGLAIGALAALATSPVKKAIDPVFDWIPFFGKGR